MSFGSNSGKSYLILEDSIKILSAEEYVALGVKIDNNLTFYYHLKQLCNKALNKLSVLTRIAPSPDLNQIKLTCNSFFKKHLSHCPLVFTFCLKRSNYLINKFQERALIGTAWTVL